VYRPSVELRATAPTVNPVEPGVLFVMFRWGVLQRVNVTHRNSRNVGARCAQRHGLPGCVCVTEFCVMIVLYARVSTTDQITAHQVT
jgi:hypothetical protein